MKLVERVRAYRAINEMMAEEWDFGFIYPLVKLMAELSADYEFFSREEMKLVSRFGKKEEDGTVVIDAQGGFLFENNACAEDYARCHRELEGLEAVETEKISLICPSLIKGEWLKALLPFCVFEGREGDHGKTA